VTNFFSLWASLEINILRFLALLINSSNQYKNKSAALIYFIPQATSSSIFFVFVIMGRIKRTYFNLIILPIIAICIKLGAAPFHFWFVKISAKVNHNIFFILSIIQKLIPYYILILMNNSIFWLVVTINFLIRIVGRIREFCLLKILRFSSLFSLGIMLISNNFILGLIYLLLYGVRILIVLTVLKTNNIFFLNQLRKIGSANLFIFFLARINIVGIPPFILFAPKVSIVLSLISEIREFFLLIIFLSSVPLAFVYLKLRIYGLSYRKFQKIIYFDNKIHFFFCYFRLLIFIRGPLFI